MLSLDAEIRRPLPSGMLPMPRDADIGDGHEFIVTDATCALPTAWLRHQRVKVVPYSVNLAGIMMTDTRDDGVCAEFAQSDTREFHRALNAPGGLVVSQGLMGHLLQISNLPIVGLTAVAAHRWGAYDYQDWVRCLQLIQLSYVRSRAGAFGARPELPFCGAWLHPAQLSCTSVGIQVAQLCALREGHADRRSIDQLARNVYRGTRTLVTLGEGRQAPQRRLWPLSASSGEFGPRMRRLLRQSPVLALTDAYYHELCWAHGRIGARTAQLQLATRNVEAGLTVPLVVIAFAGLLDELNGVPEFDALLATCRRHQVQVHLTTMPILPCIRLGPGALEISFVAPRLTV